MRSGWCCATRTAACSRRRSDHRGRRCTAGWPRCRDPRAQRRRAARWRTPSSRWSTAPSRSRARRTATANAPGNADLIPIAADLVLKLGADALPEGSVEHLTELAHYVAEIANLSPEARQPYAGRYAFTHKAGLHTSGVARVPRPMSTSPPIRREPSRRRGDRQRRRRVDPDEGRGIRTRAGPTPAIPLAPSRELKERKSRWLHIRHRRGFIGTVAAPGGRMVAVLVRDRELPGPRRGTHRRRGRWPRRRLRWSPRARGTSRAPRGKGPVGALDNALRKALSNEYPQLDDMEARGLPRPGARSQGVGTGAVAAGADRHVERRARVDHRQ